MKWLAKIFVSLLYFHPLFSSSYAVDKNDDRDVHNLTSPRKSQTIENRSPYVKRNGVLDLHRLTQLEAYKEVVRYITDGYHQSKILCHVMTGRGTHTNPNGTKGVLRAKFPEWVQTLSLVNFIKSYRFDEPNGTYIVRLRQPNNYIYDLIPSTDTHSLFPKKTVIRQQDFPKLSSRRNKD